MATAYVAVVIMALLPQVLFSILYWTWIPTWIKNPYGRLAQLDAWCRIILLSVFLFINFFGKGLDPNVVTFIFILAFLPLVYFGGLQLILLRRAAKSAPVKTEEGAGE